MAESSSDRTLSVHFTIPEALHTLVLGVVDTWAGWFDHPYMQALLEGTLDEDVFLYALQQEQLLFHGHLSAAGLLQTRATELALWDTLQSVLDWIREQVELEDEPALCMPETLAYRNHLIASAVQMDFPVALTGWLIYLWLRAELAFYVERRRPEIDVEHPFHGWIVAGRDSRLVQALESLLGRADHQEDRQQATARALVFRRSACYAWRMLEQAWKREHWSCPDDEAEA